MMRPEDREQLLSMLTDVSTEPHAEELPSISDEHLAAYRRGALSEADAASLEALLVAHPSLRRRMRAIAGIASPAAPADVRERVLAHVSRPETVASTPRPRPWSWAAGLAAAAALALFVLRPTPEVVLPDRGPVPAYDITVAALSRERGTTGIATLAEAFADTPVTVEATVSDRAKEGIEVGLYRLRRNRLVRVDDGRGVTRTDRPGAVEIEIAARDLVGTSPGKWPFFVTIAWQGDLPNSMRLDPNDDPSAILAENGRRGVHRLTLRLLAPRQTSLSFDGGLTPDEETNHAIVSTDPARMRVRGLDPVLQLAGFRHGDDVPGGLRPLSGGHHV